MKKTVLYHRIKSAAKTTFAFCVRNTGIGLVYSGVVLYVIFYLTGLTNYNILNILPLLLIVMGTVGFVHKKKTEGQY